jgi:rod shape-determining protein MreC
MALAQRSGRSRHRLVLLVLTAVTFLTLDFRDFGPLDSAQSAVRDLLEPVASLTSTVFSPVTDVWNGLFDYDDLEKENEALRLELDELRGQQLTDEADLAAFEALREAIDIEHFTDLESVVARVTRGSVGNFDEDVVTIDKGSRDGLESDMVVVTGAGLVGVLDQVDGTTSTVQLLSDRDLVVGGRLGGIDEVGLARAKAGADDVVVVDRGLNWPEGGDEEDLPVVGSAVVTDAVSKYPAGIPVGVVAAVTTPDDLTMIVDVQLQNALDDLSYVRVLLAIPADEPPEEVVVPGTTLPAAPPPEAEADGSSDDEVGG